jgi:molybdopterin-guanine dinucleotide biosynthesis protein
MKDHFHYGSVTRIAGLVGKAFAVESCPRSEWRSGDYVVGEVVERGGAYRVEWPDGHLSEVVAGERVVGALGSRCATLELVGDWRAIGSDLQMHALTDAAVFGWCTSRAVLVPAPMALRYTGHVVLGGHVARMASWSGQPSAVRFELPVIQVIGTSMECGKTTAARAVIRRLKQRGLRVAGAKLTGVARYHDVQTMRDAGADFVLDFVDVGLPSSLLERDAFAAYVDRMLRLIADQPIDVVVVEAGASPMEPYNGDVAMERLREHVQLTLLAATDLYAVLGASEHLSMKPDLVVGRVASTSAGVAIVERLTGVRALDPLDPASLPMLDTILARVRLAPGPAA